MKTIIKNSTSELVIKKSKFISYLYKVDSIIDVNKYLDKIRKDYSDATHICYAYVIDNNIKCSDDNEPNGTAGKPILNVLIKNELNYTLAIVIRYFGGIKLGASGLIRAYTNSILGALENNQIIELEKGYQVQISVPYDKQKLLNNLIKDEQIKEKIFDLDLIYIVNINNDTLNVLEQNNINYQIIKEQYIKKTDK